MAPFWASVPLICKMKVLDPLFRNWDELWSHGGRSPTVELLVFVLFLAVFPKLKNVIGTG